ncbi:MAG: NUDIX hydrolase [Candidatus Shapirobacteria bacterium]|nr:NUDIX hydrolase [Candidatus Shapirobacteria bacterium]
MPVAEKIMNSREKESKTFINLGVVLNSKGEVLLIKRKKPEQGAKGAVLTWAFPGGKQKYEELRKEGVEREVLAETGYQVKALKEISLRYHPEFPVIIVYHLCKTEDSKQKAKPSEPWEVEEIRWVKPEEIRNLITSNLDEKVAKELKI